MRSLMITAHDYRSRRKVNIHFIADELAKYGPTHFFSCQYSLLSKLKLDVRRSIDKQANKVELHEGVNCYLWKTTLHPINMRKALFSPIENFMFERYIHNSSPVLLEWIKQVDIVFFESGIAPIFFKLVQHLNPRAKTVYIASDDLETINVASYVRATFAQVAPQMDALCFTSKHMIDRRPGLPNSYVIPHGFDYSVEDHADPSPYGLGRHVVSVGSMLFDPKFFIIAAKLFPDVTFHVIGSGMNAHRDYGNNVRVYDEMPHKKTLPYIKHATVGVAPYRLADVPKYLCDTSMKLMQYDFFRLPAVCPAGIVGDYPSRFGFIPGDVESIGNALRAALDAPHLPPQRMHLRWSEVVARMLSPDNFADTKPEECH